MGSGTWMSKSTDTVDPQRSRSLRNNTLPLFFSADTISEFLCFSSAALLPPSLVYPCLFSCLSLPPSSCVGRGACIQNESHTHTLLSSPASAPHSQSLTRRKYTFLPPSILLPSHRAPLSDAAIVFPRFARPLSRLLACPASGVGTCKTRKPRRGISLVPRTQIPEPWHPIAPVH